MYCRNCGSELFEHNVFCEACGQKINGSAKVQETSQPITPSINVEQNKPKTKRNRLIILLAIFLLLVAGVVAISQFNLFNFAQPTVESYVGYDIGDMQDEPEQIVEHTITLRLNFAGAEDTPPLVIAEGTTIAELPTPERPGYIFSHWASDGAGQNRLLPETPITEDSTLYAQWAIGLEPEYLYREILAQYRSAVGDNYFVGINAFVMYESAYYQQHPNLMLQHAFESEPRLSLYHAFFDIDQSGIPELLIGIGTDESNIDIYAIFTWVEGQVYLLTSRVAAGTGLQQITIHDNGIIAFVALSEDGQSWSFQRVSEGGNTLALSSSLLKWQDWDFTTYYLGWTWEQEISQEEFETIIAEYTSQIPREDFSDVSWSYRVLENGVSLDWTRLSATPPIGEDSPYDDFSGDWIGVFDSGNRVWGLEISVYRQGAGYRAAVLYFRDVHTRTDMVAHYLADVQFNASSNRFELFYDHVYFKPSGWSSDVRLYGTIDGDVFSGYFSTVGTASLTRVQVN